MKRNLLHLLAGVSLIFGVAWPNSAAAASTQAADATPASSLAPGQSLGAGDVLASPDGRYRLTMQTDGNLVETVAASARPLWATGTTGASVAVVEQPDGNLVVYRSAAAIWATGTSGSGTTLQVQNDGNLVQYRSGAPIWSSGTVNDELADGETLAANQTLHSSSGSYGLVMQADGNLVEYHSGTSIWATGTRSPGAVAVMQGDGNLVVYAGGVARWTSGTGVRGAAVVIQNDGNIVVYAAGSPLWASQSGTSGHRAEYTGYPDSSATDCSATYGIYSWCINSTWLSPRGYAFRNCTDYVAWWLQADGVADAFMRGLGNAYLWSANAPAHGDTVNSVPSVGSIAQWGAEVGHGYGHVAVVTAVNTDGSVDVAQYNQAGTGQYSIQFGVRADHYLHFPGTR